jgi:hypothetical protein
MNTLPSTYILTDSGWRRSPLVPTGPIRPNRRRPSWRWFAAGLAIGASLATAVALLARP